MAACWRFYTFISHQRAHSPWVILKKIKSVLKSYQLWPNNQHLYLAKPTPRLVPLASRRMRVEMAWLKGFNMFSSSCSSMDRGRLEMYKLVGSCSCCWKGEREDQRMRMWSRQTFLWQNHNHNMVSGALPKIKSHTKSTCNSVNWEFI